MSEAKRLGAPYAEVLDTLEGEPILVRQGNPVAATFHPALAGDPTVAGMVFASAALETSSVTAQAGPLMVTSAARERPATPDAVAPTRARRVLSAPGS